MRGLGRWVLLLGCVHGTAGASGSGSVDDALRLLPSAQTLNDPWPSVSQIEHTAGWEQHRGAVCVRLQELLQDFPARDHSALYWDLLSAQQTDRKAVHRVLGQIQGATITEIVLRFRTPIDYVKIVGFTPPDTALVCPFLVVADWEWQLEYAPSEVIRTHAGWAVRTVMRDAVAFGAGNPQPVSVTVHFDQARPARIALDASAALPRAAATGSRRED